MASLKEIRISVSIAVGCLVCFSTLAAPDRPLHRFLQTVISPDGALLASSEGDASLSGAEPPIRDLVIRKSQSGAAVTIDLPCGRVRECWPSALAWAPDGKTLDFALRTPGSHARSVYRVDADGQHLTKVLGFNGTITALRFARDGRLAMLATDAAIKEVGATQAGTPITGDLGAATPRQRIAVVNGDHLDWASPPDLFVYEYSWLPNGVGFVGTAATGDGDSQWWVAKLYAFESGAVSARVIYAPSNPRLQIAEPTVSPDGKTIAFIGGLMSDFGSTGGDVYRVTLTGGAAVNSTPAMKASTTSIAFDCSGILFAERLAGDQTQIVTLGTGDKPTPPKVVWSASESLGGENAGVSLACRSQTTATVIQSFTAAPEIYVGTIGKWRALTNANSSMATPAQVRSVHWPSDAFDVQGWLLTPTFSTGPTPLITIVHGGPAAASVPTFVGPGLERRLLEQGFALFMPNPRGSFGQGSVFASANVRDLGHGDLVDILKGIDAAERAVPIDESRLGIMGGSYGGFMTMWAVTQTQRFKAAVAAAGVSNWVSYYGENGINEWLIPYFGMSVYDDPAVYERSSPINYIRNVRTPTFAYVGENDVECPAPQTQEFWHALHDLGIPTSVVIYPKEGHGLRDPAHRADAERRVLEWFAQYLKR